MGGAALLCAGFENDSELTMLASFTCWAISWAGYIVWVLVLPQACMHALRVLHARELA